VAERLARQNIRTAGLQHQGEGFFALEQVIPVDAWIRRILKFTLMDGRGRRNCLALRVVTHIRSHPRLPPFLDGLRLLHLSDLHIDLLPELAPVLADTIQALDYDLCLLTGDYRNSTRDDYRPCVDLMKPILEAIRGPRYGILGNHDFLEMAPLLEAAGLPLLINEGVRFPWNGGELYIGGTDDPHYYQTHDISRVVAHKQEGDFGLLMAHSPEVYAEAAEHFDLMLCGHTHGGQICLPGGIAVVRNGRCPGHMIKGAWTYQGLHGYTSPGTGACGVPARFNCPPEVTLHVLRRG
jgi:hypothetical protein